MDRNILCSIDGCGNKVNARGWCSKHYSRWRKYGDPLKLGPKPEGPRKCSVEGCETKYHARGFCQNHLVKFKKYGDPTAHHESYMAVQRWLNDHKNYSGNECLMWPFGVNSTGRGSATLRGVQTSAPRAMCTLAHGDPPEEYFHAAHSCGNGREGCVNPKHLRWATPAENVMDRDMHGHNKRGTEVNTNKLTEDDVRYIRSQKGKRTGLSLAKEFGVTAAAISAIMTRKNWAWLED